MVCKTESKTPRQTESLFTEFWMRAVTQNKQAKGPFTLEMATLGSLSHHEVEAEARDIHWAVERSLTA